MSAQALATALVHAASSNVEACVTIEESQLLNVLNEESIDVQEAKAALDLYAKIEAAVFTEAKLFADLVTQQLAHGGFTGLLCRQLPDGNNDTALPPLLERSKRPVNHGKAVKTVLTEWLIQHINNPYPSDVEKAELSAKTGLPIRQISTWFQNARTRILPKLKMQMQREELESESKRRKTAEVACDE